MIISDFNAATISDRGEPVDKNRLINMYCSLKEEARSLSDICLHQDAKRFKQACSLTGGGKAPTPPPEIDPDICAPEAGDMKDANEVCINSMEQIASSVTNNLVPFCPESAIPSIGSVKGFVLESMSSKSEKTCKNGINSDKTEKIVHIKNNESGKEFAVNCGDKSTKQSKPDISTIGMTKSSVLQKLRSEEAELTISILKLR